jgi:hypothetical protein
VSKRNAKPNALIESAIKSISFAACPFHTEIKLDRRRNKFYVQLNSNDRETGEPAVISFISDVPLLTSLKQAIDWIYARTRDAWIHELNEVFFVDGAQRYDLHDNGCLVIPPDEAKRRQLLGELEALKIRFADLIQRVC